MSPLLYLGMISGTSVDGVDTVIARFGDDRRCDVVHAETVPFHDALRERLRALIETPRTTLESFGRLDRALGEFFAECALAALRKAGLDAADIEAIGHHGQTIFHAAEGPEPFTLQIGDPSVVAARTRTVTVADFRRMDVALGGQGAPLAPAFHDWAFRSETETRVIVNIGGIANVTLLEPGKPTIGFDTGPGNTLLDLWSSRCRGKACDEGGRWAATGRVDTRLLDHLLADAYFALPPPKSTGREHFNMAWLERRLAAVSHSPAEHGVQATLAELTTRTVASGIASCTAHCDRVIVCGGGAHNADLLERLRRVSGNIVETSDAHGLAPDWVEGAAFAWLARARLRHEPGNMPSVTGAHESAVLGGVYWPASRSDQQEQVGNHD